MARLHNNFTSHNVPRWALSGRIPCLDGMRALAILLVVLSHLSSHGIRGTWSLGHLGVTFFFVISGFLITLLLIRERDRSGDISAAGFYKRRALRILPAYVTLLLGIGALSVAGLYAIPLSSWARAITYTSCFSLLTMAPVLGHTWSLSVEEHFYLIWPLLFRKCSPRLILSTLAAYIVLTPILRWLIIRNHVLWLDPNYSSPSQMASIAVGCLLAVAITKGALPRRSLLAAGGIVLFLVPLLLHGFPLILASTADTFRASGAGLVMLGILFMDEGSICWRLLDSKLLVWIGVLSYSLYLWQQPLTSRSVPFWWGIPALLVVAWLSYRFVESPFLKLKDKASQKVHG